jgi:hypothetical protein
MKTETSAITQPVNIEIRKQGYKQIYCVAGTTVWHSSPRQANEHFVALTASRFARRLLALTMGSACSSSRRQAGRQVLCPSRDMDPGR